MDNDHYQPSQKEFWDYTFDEMGAIDLPTMIQARDHSANWRRECCVLMLVLVQYELNVTGRSNLTWIGHSQGTMQVMLLLAPDLGLV